MLTINRDQTLSLKDRLSRGAELEACAEEVRKMLEIKNTLLWRADNACGCVGNGPANAIYAEVQTLEHVLVAIEQGDAPKAAAILDDYLEIMFF